MIIIVKMRMPNTLVVVGEHIEEADFGYLVGDILEARAYPNIAVYHVKAKCHNCHHTNLLGDNGKNRIALQEVYQEMLAKRPNLTITVHHGDSFRLEEWAEIYAHHEYHRLKHLHSAVHRGVVVKTLKPRQLSLPEILEQTTIPYIGLEMRFEEMDNTPPYEKQARFAVRTIQKIRRVYMK
ncbi:MAG: hypothetical protein KJ559_02270 [Nanoarchaeota archaeon]|nr:hypothetical protein [Nanoarchaeota archaeon]